MTDNTTLDANKDPMGRAIHDYYTTQKAARLKVLSSMFYEDVLPVATLFRKFNEMPSQERKALGLAKGKVLDVGAGAGCHSLELMRMGAEVVAIDISPLSVEVMRKRGVNAHCVNFFDETFCGSFDTILLTMNGIGIVGTTKRLPDFFRRAKSLLSDGGQILLDSSDIRYVFQDKDGSFDIDLADNYYGEVDYRMKYKNVTGERFDWLYIDFETLKLYANESGFDCEKCADGEHYDYLAKLTVRK